MDVQENQTNYPLGSGIIINSTQVKDPSDNKIYKNTSFWGAILLGDNAAWQRWNDWIELDDD